MQRSCGLNQFILSASRFASDSVYFDNNKKYEHLGFLGHEALL